MMTKNGQLKNAIRAKKRKLDKQIDRLKDHYIVCGYGRIGRVLCNRLRSGPITSVVIECDPEMVTAMEDDGISLG